MGPGWKSKPYIISQYSESHYKYIILYIYIYILFIYIYYYIYYNTFSDTQDSKKKGFWKMLAADKTVPYKAG